LRRFAIVKDLYVRLRDSATRYYDFVSGLWVTSESANCRLYLNEYADSDHVESRYQSTYIQPTVDVIAEYVRVDDRFVIGEEQIKYVALKPGGA
jgi:hypothetical protein